MDIAFLSMKRLFLLLLPITIILAACEAQATPVGLMSTPTDMPEPVATTEAPLHYGLYANVVGYVQDLDAISKTASVENMSANSNLSDYDVVVAFGTYDGWQQSPIQQHLSLVINPNLAPLNDEAIINIVRQAFDIQDILGQLNITGSLPGNVQTVSTSETKTALANAGFPDGFVLTMAANTVPALEAIAAQFTERNIDLHIIQNESDALSSNRAHLLLSLWTQDSQRAAWVEQVGEANVFDLFSLPISYIARDGLNITFTENGWPIPAR